MPYTTDKNMPRIRREAARLVARGWSTRKVARHFGYSQSVVVKWFQKSKKIGDHPIPTKSSKPHSHPKQLSRAVVQKIIDIRIKIKRTSEVVHEHLRQEGISVSINSVRRTIDNAGLMKKRSPWKRYHPPVDRPYPVFPGALVEIDTIHTMQGKKKRMYTFVIIDVYSRWAYAKAYQRMNAATAVYFVREAQAHAPFKFQMLQSDHGPEFGSWFVSRIKKDHRYTRIGKPNDNAHIERLNRTLQEECLDREIPTPAAFNCALKKYLRYYNDKRLHLGIALRAPNQLLAK